MIQFTMLLGGYVVEIITLPGSFAIDFTILSGGFVVEFTVVQGDFVVKRGRSYRVALWSVNEKVIVVIR